MSTRSTRRRFLQSTAASGALLSLGNLSFLSQLRPVSAAEAELDPKIVRLQPEIEPLVRLIEETPRERLLEEVGSRVQRGLSYRDLLAALLLAGVRNVQPRPSVGFKFHAVLVVNSAHLASLSSPDSDRWLPIFWALDHFKSSQARDVEEGDWTMPRVEESRVPTARKARQAFIDAMDNWDEQAADAAVAGLARTAGSNDLFDLFAHYGGRDFRSIGHKAIFVANSWRTLNCIGWQHAEPVLRSLAYALLYHEGEANPATSDLGPDRPGRQNRELASRIRDDWQDGKTDSAATAEMLAVLREDSGDEACEKMVAQLNAGVAPQSLWDACFDAAGELLLRQPAIVSLHAVTTTNALYYNYVTTAADTTRRWLLLQNAAFLPLFREAMRSRGEVRDQKIEALEPAEVDADSAGAIDEIFTQVSDEPMSAARKILGYLDAGGDAKRLIDQARRLIFLKGDNAHDYKFSSAVLEDYYHASPAWRNRFLASSAMLLRGSGDQDNDLVERTRAALTA